MVRMFVNPDKCYDVVPKGSLVPRPHPGDVGSGHETNCRGNPIHVRDVLGKLPAWPKLCLTERKGKSKRPSLGKAYV